MAFFRSPSSPGQGGISRDTDCFDRLWSSIRGWTRRGDRTRRGSRRNMHGLNEGGIGREISPSPSDIPRPISPRPFHTIPVGFQGGRCVVVVVVVVVLVVHGRSACLRDRIVYFETHQDRFFSKAIGSVPAGTTPLTLLYLQH